MAQAVLEDEVGVFKHVVACVLHQVYNTRKWKRNNEETSSDKQSSGQQREDSMHQDDQAADAAVSDGLNNGSDSEWSNDDPFIKTFQFNQIEGLNINVVDGDHPIFFFNLFMTDHLFARYSMRIKCICSKCYQLLSSILEK